MAQDCVIGEAARQSGVGIETIRYYERTGLIPPPARSTAGQRLFSPADVARLRFVRRCRDLGFAIPDIRQLIVLAEDRAPSCAEAEEIGQRHLLAIRHRRAGLERLEAALLGLLEGCREDRPDCALLRALMRPPAPGIR